MNRFFTAVAAASAMVTPAAALADTQQMSSKEANHLRYQSVQLYRAWTQTGMVDHASLATYALTIGKAAIFANNKTGAVVMLDCHNLSTNLMMAAHHHTHGRFVKEMKKAEGEMHCISQGPLI